MNLDKLSYKSYGNLVIATLILLAVAFTLFPFTFDKSIRDYILNFVLYIIMIPIYLKTREKFDYPIHCVGLNRCFVCTTTFYIILDVLLYLSIKYLGHSQSFVLGTLIVCLSTYFTSEITNIQEGKGKLFWGFKNNGEPSKYDKLIEYLKFNILSDEYIKAEELLKKVVETKQFLIYKRIFIDKHTWSSVEDEFDVNRLYISKTLDQCYFYMIGRLGL